MKQKITFCLLLIGGFGLVNTSSPNQQLQKAIETSNIVKLWDVLQRPGVLINKANKKGNTPLHKACVLYAKNKENLAARDVVSELLTYGSSLKTKNNHNETPQGILEKSSLFLAIDEKNKKTSVIEIVRAFYLAYKRKDRATCFTILKEHPFFAEFVFSLIVMAGKNVVKPLFYTQTGPVGDDKGTMRSYVTTLLKENHVPELFSHYQFIEDKSQDGLLDCEVSVEKRFINIGIAFKYQTSYWENKFEKIMSLLHEQGHLYFRSNFLYKSAVLSALPSLASALMGIFGGSIATFLLTGDCPDISDAVRDFSFVAIATLFHLVSTHQDDEKLADLFAARNAPDLPYLLAKATFFKRLSYTTESLFDEHPSCLKRALFFEEYAQKFGICPVLAPITNTTTLLDVPQEQINYFVRNDLNRGFVSCLLYGIAWGVTYLYKKFTTVRELGLPYSRWPY